MISLKIISSSSTSLSKRLQPVYLTFKTFANKEEAVNVLKDEKVWSMNTKPKKRICKNTVHEFYRCSSSVECPVKACVVYKSDEDTVTVKKSCNIEHNHEKLKEDRGLNYDTRKAIDHLYAMGTKTALPIIYALRDKEILSSKADIEVDNIQEPTPRQINNYLLNTLKPKVQEKCHFNYGELCEWVQSRTFVPEDEHEPFILAQYFNINDHIPSASSFKISMSTKFLVQLGRYSDHTCTDTTHKVMWEGFPLFLNGTTDMCRSYQPQSISICTQETEKEFEFAFNAIKDSLLNIFDYNYRPTILVADGAEAITNGFMKAFNYVSIEEFIRIMCWSHVDRAYKAKLLKVKSKKIQESCILVANLYSRIL